MQVSFQAAGSIVVIVGNLSVLERGHQRHEFLGASESNVEPFFAASHIDGTEVHTNFAFRVWAVADAQNNDVTFVPLNVLQVPDQEASELSVIFSFQLCLQTLCEVSIGLGKSPDRTIDLRLLSFREGHNSE